MTITRIYVIGPKQGPFKVGLAKNVEQRLAALQMGNHLELVIHFREDIFHIDSLPIETRAHAHLFDKTIRGEWFDCSIEDAITAITLAIQEVEEIQQRRALAYHHTRTQPEKSQLDPNPSLQAALDYCEQLAKQRS